MYTSILDQLSAETNLYRKTECFKFAKNIIQLHQVDCISESDLKIIICDSLDVCTNEAVADILLDVTLQVIYYF